MAATDAYALHVYDEDLVKQAIITDFISLFYIRRVNWFDGLWFSVAGDHPVLSGITDKWLFNLRRRRADGTWDDEVWTLFRDELWTYGENGSTFSGYCEGITSFLSWRIINYPAGVSNRSSWTDVKGESLMRLLARYNAGTGATLAIGRKRVGTIKKFATGTDTATGNTVASWNCHGENLLQTLADVAILAGGDFKITKEPSATWPYVFQFYLGQMGTDKSATISFSVNLGNMLSPQYKVTRSSEKTVACTWGRGAGASREYATRTGDNYVAGSASVFGQDIETYVDAKSIDPGDTSGLNAKGDAKMDKTKAKETFTFEIGQTEGYRYREDYDLGDLVTAVNPFNSASSTYKIWSVAVELSEDGKEKIEVELED